MKKFGILGILLITFIAYAVHQKSEDESATPVSSTNSPHPGVSSTTQNPNTSSSTNAASRNTSYKDGTYLGDATDAFYGTIQIQAIIQNGKISDISFLQYPNDRGESIQINSQAMPLLKQEAIQAQNATVDTISGATQTSEAFNKSLASALAKAQ